MLSKKDERILLSVKRKINYYNNQIDLYYNKGRPLFNYYNDNNYIIYKNKFNNKKSIKFI